MKSLLLASMLFGAACVTTTTSPPPAINQPTPTEPIVTPPPATGDMLNASGHFNQERVYKGRCAPAGSRGGCYVLTVRPDASFTYVLLDVAISGTYQVVSGSVVLTRSDGSTEAMPLAADGSMVGDLPLQQ